MSAGLMSANCAFRCFMASKNAAYCMTTHLVLDEGCTDFCADRMMFGSHTKGISPALQQHQSLQTQWRHTGLLIKFHGNKLRVAPSASGQQLIDVTVHQL